MAKALAGLAAVNAREQRADDADRCYRQAISMYRQTVSPQHPDLEATVRDYNRFLKSFRK
jgi:hypothetical protein